ncbi:lytic transglycosylase domain-containing protein [Candidatus Zixiibacteriota bacterium]
MKYKQTDRPSFMRSIVFIAVAVLVSLLFLQQQEIDRLRTLSKTQAEIVTHHQKWATTAISHLELIKKYNIPYRYLEILAETVREHDLDLEFMVGLMQVESSFNQNAVSNKDAYGLMQVRMGTALELDPTIETFWQLYSPERNIRLGSEYFRKLLDRYGGDYRMAALAYNRGPTRLDVELSENIDISDHYYRKIRTAGSMD